MTWRKEADELGRSVVFYRGYDVAFELTLLHDDYLEQWIRETIGRSGEYAGTYNRLEEELNEYGDDYEPVEALRKSLKKAIRTSKKALKL